jgi:tripartite ATP-independent transporter DctM subunit
MIPDLVGWMFPLIFSLIFLGIPVAFTLIFTGFLFGCLIFDFNIWLVSIQMHDRLLDVTSNFVLAAIPLFIMMGAVLERSGLAQRLFTGIQIWLYVVPNGLGLTTLIMCTLLAAASGVVGAVEVLVGLMAIPAMKKARYKDDLIAGTVCAGGSLGTIIPPSVLVVVYASSADISVGDMLAGVIFPGLMMVAGFGIYILVRGFFEKKCPAPPAAVLALSLGEKLKITLTAVVPTMLLIVLVLGSILTGTATPTEAGALGVAGAVVLALFSQGLTWRTLWQALSQTIQVTGAITVIIFGGVAFTSVFVIGGGKTLILDTIAIFELSGTQTLLVFLLMIFVLGFLLDWVSVILISIPIFAPVVRIYGIDPIWFGVLVCIMLQTSYLTPPMAPSIFYLRSIAPSDMSYRSMYLGVLPFIAIQLIVLAIVLLYPLTATYLPTVLFRL